MHKTANVGPLKLIPEKWLNLMPFTLLQKIASSALRCSTTGKEVVLLNTEEYKQSSEYNHLDGDIKESIGKVKTTGKQKPYRSCICLLKQEKSSWKVY